MRALFSLILVGFFGFNLQAGYRIQQKVVDGKVEIYAAKATNSFKNSVQPKLLRKLPYYFHTENKTLQNVVYEEYSVPAALASDKVKKLAEKYIKNLKDKRADFGAEAETRTLVLQGPKENRINLTILGDGYTVEEKQKFFDDAERTVNGLFGGRTFKSYLPLFNVYAVFVPSKESGLGDGSPKNTAFRLYRDPKGSKRAIMPGDQGALEDALDLAPATDYPIVLANDEFYGGLGGRFAITTSSARTGLIVLRHELGHNFGEVGEEYDNGQVYMGANSSRRPQVPWTQWVEGGGPAVVHEARLLSGQYVWQNLSAGPYKATFRIPAGIDQMFFVFSSVGWSSPDDVSILLNNQTLKYDGVFHVDRSFFNVAPVPVTTGSTYDLIVKENIADKDNVLGFALAYGAPANYDFTPNKIGAFATYNDRGTKFYRPTHESCLMRNMEIDHFCSVDYENMWKKFLNRVTLIDSLAVDGDAVVLKTQDLPYLAIQWSKLGLGGAETVIPEFNNLKQVPKAGLTGKYRVKVQFQTPEVRNYDNNFTQAKEIQL